MVRLRRRQLVEVMVAPVRRRQPQLHHLRRVQALVVKAPPVPRVPQQVHHPMLLRMLLLPPGLREPGLLLHLGSSRQSIEH